MRRMNRLALAVGVLALSLCAQEPAKTESLFDGRSLDGWQGDANVWKVENGCIRGSSVGGTVKRNTFLIWDGGQLADFELSFDVRLVGNNNSGVQYRSRRLKGEGFRMAGYQCDVHSNPRYFGMLYDEQGRGIVAQHGQQVVCGADGKPRVTSTGPAPDNVDLEDWHSMRIVARGSRLQHFVDGQLAVEIVDDWSKAARQGEIALQVHSGAPMTVWFRNLKLKRLPTEEVALVPAAAEERAVPQWIWDATAENDEELFFRREFRIEAKPKSAQLAVTCDNHCHVFLNGERIVKSDTWEAPRIVDVGKRLQVGDNVLAVYGWNDGGPAALCAQLSWASADGRRHDLCSDEQWLVSDDDPDGWDQVGFDDSKWQRATVHAPLGGGVWAGALPQTAFNDILIDEGPQLPELSKQLEMRAPATVERLFRVPKSMGSWVCLASDERGRIYASDQNAGLYRIHPAGVDGAERTSVERIDVDLGGCQGLCWAFGSLYAVVNGKGSGLYRLRDTDGDDKLDDVELLRKLEGRGEHGPHAIEIAPDGEHLLVLCGNHTKLPELARSRLPLNWNEDRIVERLNDPRGHAVGRMAPGGYLCLVDPDGEEWELLTAGFRNAYDMAIHPETGDVFVYDADMEWDMGLPWYRPTRILQCVSGADYGWRHGSGKWPVDFPDTLPAVADIGPGSPTGLLFATGANSPEVASKMLATDWTFGTIYQLELRQQGGGWTAETEEFAAGVPFPVTDAVVGADGRLYIATGGRGLPSQLFRVDWPAAVAGAQTAAAESPGWNRERRLRRELEQFHGRVDPTAVDAAWPHLGHKDPFVRHAARLAVEWQPVAQWRDRALNEQDTLIKLGALLALARCGTNDDLEPLLEALASISGLGLDESDAVDYVRIHELALVRLGPASDELRRKVAERVLELLPSGSVRVDRELCGLLASLDAPGLLERAMPLLAEMRPSEAPPWALVATRNARYGGAIREMLGAMPPMDQIDMAVALRMVSHGWTLEQRQDYFGFLEAARARKGGNSYDGYLKAVIDAAYENCSPAEQAALAEVVGKAKADPEPFRSRPAKGPGRDWQMADAVALATRGLRGRDYASGRNLFHAVGCASCHRFVGEGGAHGPDLTSLGNKFTAADVLEAILEPSKVVSDQYAGSVLTRRDGSTLFGRVVEGADSYTVVPAVAEATVVEIPSTEVASVAPSKLSPMPADLIDSLSEAEMLDLLAFLLSRGDESGPMFDR